METKDLQLSQVSIEDQMRDAYLEYAMSVIVGRALPDVRDGMKPVHRRVLYAMYDMSNTYDKAYKKSARIVGDVIGKYHPHGDTAVYETMVRMAQDFSLRYTLVDGQGNFGSVDGDAAAAMRYTEVRLAKITNEVLADLEKETVNFNPNYDNSLQEPAVLPTKIPTLLVNGSSGIAVGMATNIPPHNLGEIVDGIKAVVANPAISISELMQIIPGPDFPTAGFIYGRKGLKEAYHTGKGIIHLRAKADVEEIKNDKQRIVITEIPYQVNKAKLIESIAELVRDKKVEGISDIRDESDRDGMRVVFDLKKGEDSRVILNQLYKNSQMQVSFGISMLALDHQQPKLLNLKECLVAFLQHRKEVVTKRTVFDLRKAEEKAHILEALKKAVENLDEVVSLIRKAANPAEAQEKLIAKFSFTEVQAKAILEMRLQRLTGLEREKIVADYNETMTLIADLKAILSDEKRVLAIIEKELDEVKKSFGDPRRTDFIEEQEEMSDEDYIVEEEMVVTVTYSGYIKRLPVDAYRAQRRGGKGVIGAATKSEDFIQDIFVASTHENILCFTDQGRVYWLKVHKIPEAGRAAKGKPIVNLLNLTTNERIQAVLPVKEFKETEFVTIVTRQGTIKKTTLGAFARPMKKGIIAITTDDGDSLVDAKITNGNNHIILVSKFGQSIRFEEQDVRPMGRTARGVAGMRLDEGDLVIGMAVVAPDDATAQVLTVTQKGYGKRTLLDEYRVQGRGGSGVITMKITDKNGPVVAVRQVKDEDDLIIASDRGKVIRTRVSEISEVGRVAQGVRLITMDEGETVGAVAKIVEKDEEQSESKMPEVSLENKPKSGEDSGNGA
ncbi:MAG: DNA gyrase subunit A [Deltaproteobacteria bacterium]|nr:DNA gyrase subunit A [Deltaproteobacteria bacterium]